MVAIQASQGKLGYPVLVQKLQSTTNVAEAESE